MREDWFSFSLKTISEPPNITQKVWIWGKSCFNRKSCGLFWNSSCFFFFQKKSFFNLTWFLFLALWIWKWDGGLFLIPKSLFDFLSFYQHAFQGVRFWIGWGTLSWNRSWNWNWYLPILWNRSPRSVRLWELWSYGVCSISNFKFLFLTLSFSRCPDCVKMEQCTLCAGKKRAHTRAPPMVSLFFFFQMIQFF